MTTTFIDSNTLSATLEAPRLTAAREGDLLVRNRGPAGNTVSSLPVTFTVGSASPTITALTGVPDEVLARRLAFDITVEGSGFEDGVVGRVNGIARPTTFVDETSFTMTVADEDLTVAGTLVISALNPAPTAGPSNEQTISVLNPIAGLLSISPDLIVARPDETSPAVPITVTGFSFVDGAVVLLEGTEVPTQFVNSTTLSAEIPASLVTEGEPKRVTVQNPEPVVARAPPSETLPRVVINPIPVLDSIRVAPVAFEDNRPFRPDGTTAQTFPILVILNGSNFNGSTTAFFGIPACEPALVADAGTLLNSNQMVFEITITCSGVWSVLMESAQPGGGESQTLTFTIGDTAQTTLVPQITSISPGTVSAGSNTFNLTLSGANFTVNSSVLLGTAVLTPTSVVANQIVVSVPSILVGASGVLPVTVRDPDAGTSNRVFLTISP